MFPLNEKWLKSYKEQDNLFLSAIRGYDYKTNWLGAWRLMRDFQNTLVIKDIKRNKYMIKQSFRCGMSMERCLLSSRAIFERKKIIKTMTAKNNKN